MRGNCPASPRRHWADFHHGFLKKRSEKTPKTGKYEGKLNFAQFNSERVGARKRCAGARLFCGSAVPFILAAQKFQEMFTSYSQLLPFCPASGLETRNRN
jgi:hypothetical protein